MSWTRGQVIGQGSTATVSVAKFNQSGDTFAVKSIELDTSESLRREGKLLSSLNCPQIVKYKGCDITCENNKLVYNVFMEYVTGGTLSDEIHKHGGTDVNESSIKLFTRQVLQGLQYLHSKGIVHCDIKGKNILIDERGDVKLADFGCAKLINSFPGVGSQISGTPLFMAPEVAKGLEQGFESDIWALGCTIIEMASGGSPWPNFSDPLLVLYQIAYSDELPEFPSFLSDQARDFLSKCLCRNKEQRWTASQLLGHPFLADFVSHEKQIVESKFNSPTSILDQDVWNSLEVARSPLSQVEFVQTNSWNSPASRIDRLALVSEVPTWSSDENWDIIREEKASTCSTGDEDEMYWGSGKTATCNCVGSTERCFASASFTYDGSNSRNDDVDKVEEESFVYRVLNFEKHKDDSLRISSIIMSSNL